MMRKKRSQDEMAGIYLDEETKQDTSVERHTCLYFCSTDVDYTVSKGRKEKSNAKRYYYRAVLPSRFHNS